MALWMACAGGGFEGDAIELAPATVTEPYLQRIGEVRGDHRFELVSGELPPGIFLHGDGVLTGTPSDGGPFAFSVGYRESQVDLVLDVDWPDDMLACGRSIQVPIEAVNPGAALGNHATWEPAESWSMLRVAPPSEHVHRMTLTSEPAGLWFYWAIPGAVVGEGTIDTDLWRFGDQVNDFDEPDIDTWTAFGTPVDLGAVGWRVGDYTVHMDCGVGPGFDTDGDMLFQGHWGSANWSTLGGDLGVDFALEGSIPAGLEFDADWARIDGAAEQGGVFPITIVADDGQSDPHRYDTELRVQHRAPVACGDTVTVTTDDFWMNEGADGWFGAADPREYRIYTLDVPEGTSRLEVSWSSGTVSGGFFDVQRPVPAEWDYFPGYAEAFSLQPGSVALSPLFNDIRRYTSQSEALVFGQGTGDLTVTCDLAPRLGETLPVPHPDGGSWTLEAYGGSPPYSWSAQGLPQGVEIDADGVLTASGVSEGGSNIQIDLTDSVGGASSEAFELFIGEDAACGSVPVLRCGETLSGFNDDNAPVACLVPRPGQSVRLDNTLGTRWNYLSIDTSFAWVGAGEVVELELPAGEYATQVWTNFDEPYVIERVCP